MIRIRPLVYVVSLAVWASCEEDPGRVPAPENVAESPTAKPAFLNDVASRVLENYANLVHRNYRDAVRGARELENRIHAFLARPSPEGFEGARAAWLAARESYGPSEAFRFYGGPIDDAERPLEGRVNAWPLDEAAIEAPRGAPGTGILQRFDVFPVLTRELLIEQNEKESEKSVTLGYHAIEFLLWGADTSPDGPGNRSWTDYESGLATQDRRREYLRIVAGLLAEDLELVADAWAPAQDDNYRAAFVRLPPREGVRRILVGLGSLSGGELAGERMAAPYDTKDQEEEHSCFSDNTHRDLYLNEAGVRGVWLGRYDPVEGDRVEGPSLESLVRAIDPALAGRVSADIEAAMGAIQAIPAPFDRAIQGTDASPGRVAVRRAIDLVWTQTRSLAAVAKALGIEIGFDEE